MASGSGQEAALPITNTLFPPPPPYYQAFTEDNLDQYEVLAGTPLFRKDKGKGRAQSQDIPSGVADGEDRELVELRAKLEPPRADWVDDDGRWMCFGQMYTTEPSIPTAESIGLPPMIDPGVRPQEALPPLLHSFLHTLLLLLDTLTHSARTPDELLHAGWAHEGDQYIQHLTNLSATMMVSSNQLRGVQSETTLVLMMEKELEERRRQTEVLESKNKEIAHRIAQLRRLKL
ncbi:hypothetical protein IAU60_003113 [Kwoniella sp. DSM 27419]